ncbi:hypothetical protein DESUT3_04710 [Desulfuromonas versatilis]|uniref:Uncharacterized protein n=1 Tax=Desulfuromonas versatilis TaxID=2802975 RepID=A0ABN6DTC2_9BACT|nr:hypothetical protein [Desulfuromonas versatilis]BCR03402.1 hypothetical protein DESUT3_04710 [Desulfuromonas versatilis]
MTQQSPNIPKLFISTFTVDYAAPFRRHLNRLEVEIGKEDYRHLKRIELLDSPPEDAQFAGMEEITERLLKTTQNNYNRELLLRLGIRVYLDPLTYAVYYRLADRSLRFSAKWRQKVLSSFFGTLPTGDTGWTQAGSRLPGFEARFVADGAGGVLLLRQDHLRESDLPLLTATHGPYDPHTLDVALFFLRCGKGSAAVVNLGFSGREPLTDTNLEKLRNWGVPLNPSNIDVIYPYVDAGGHPYCYKLEEGLRRYVELLELAPPPLIIDIHGCVGTRENDRRLVVGLGGFPPYPQPEKLGQFEEHGELLHLAPAPRLRQGLALLRELSEEIFVQLCTAPHHGLQFLMLGGLQLMGRAFDPRAEAKSLLEGEERTYLPEENVRWLPGAGGNAIQRIEARKLRPDVICLHVEIPTSVRRRIALKLREMEITSSLDSSSL